MGKKLNLTIIGIACFIFFLSIIFSLATLVSQSITGTKNQYAVFPFVDLIPLIIGLYLLIKSLKEKKFYDKNSLAINIFSLGMVLTIVAAFIVATIMSTPTNFAETVIVAMKIRLIGPIIISLITAILLFIKVNKKTK